MANCSKGVVTLLECASVYTQMKCNKLLIYYKYFLTHSTPQVSRVDHLY